MNTAARSVCGLYLPNPSDISTPIKYVDYNGVCYLGRQSIEPYGYFEKFKHIGTKKVENFGKVPVIGVNENLPVAAIVDDTVVDELVEALNVEPSPEVVPFILAIVAIDAGLQAAMWAAYIAAHQK